LVAEMIRSENR